MKMILTGMVWVVTASLGEAADFVPPQQYPVSRYEAGWQTNPFTLKTAPVALQRDSFAKDLVLGSVTKIGESATVTVVNTKTRARTPVRDDASGPGGMKIKSVHLEDARKDTYVELQMGNESAVLRYDENFLKQLVAARPPQQGGNVTGGSGANGNTSAILPINNAAAAAGTTNNAVTLPTGGNPGQPYNANQPSTANSMNVALPTIVPTPTRRRMLTAPVPNQPR